MGLEQLHHSQLPHVLHQSIVVYVLLADSFPMLCKFQSTTNRFLIEVEAERKKS